MNAENKLRALTLIRPWDQAIVRGSKRIENRSWRPWDSIIGKVIAIHAGQKYDPKAAEWMRDELLFDAPDRHDYPAGVIVGLARITGCIETSDDPWFVGPFGWTLDDVAALSAPVPCRGAQGLWHVPKSVRVAISAQLRGEK